VHGIKTYPDPTVAIFGLELFKGRAVRLFFLNKAPELIQLRLFKNAD
jgi:hypothetical protein